MRIKVLLAAVMMFGLLSSSNIYAQNDQGFIYGKVITQSGNEYQGPIRWGKEEVFWCDIFNGRKTKNEYRDIWRRSKSVTTNDYPTGSMSYNSTKEFKVQFGYIAKLTPYGTQEVELEMQNGKHFFIQNGSNDFGEEIHIMDQDLGEVEVQWRNIKHVEFLGHGNKLEEKFGEPLYGTVKTWEGDFTGFIQWDHDERLSTDVLDGETEDGDVSIPFEKLKTIAKSAGGCEIITKSGRSFYLDGSNDVNSGNDGIIVNIPNKGRVDIPWSSFRSVRFEQAPNGMMHSYEDYKDIYKLAGTVEVDQTVNGNRKSYTGGIVYDIDEAWNFEILDGKNGKIEYLIPFNDIKGVSPSGYRYSYILFKDGKGVELSDGNDVNQNNNGLLMFLDGKETIYIPWKRVKKINFK